MRLAIVSDIHGNLTALEAVIADLETAGADVVLHGGDLVASGARPAEVVDVIRDVGLHGGGDASRPVGGRLETYERFKAPASARQKINAALVVCTR